MHGVTAFLFVKGTAAGEAEGLVAEGQLAASLDTLERLRTVPEVDRVVVSTASAEFAAAARALGAQIEMDPAGKKFHWGHRLAELVSKHSASVPLYVGGVSGPLMSAADWRALVRRILGQRNSVVTNNLFSCDYAAWTPGKTIQDIDPPPLDNDLAFRLARRAGLRILALEKDAATQLDIDTPSDLVALSLHPGLGPHLREFLSRSDLDLSRARAVLSTLRDGDATGFIAGRVSASMMLLLEKETLCQWRVFSEERGMRASGRQERGQARSLVGLYLEIVGAKRFFDAV